MKNKRTTLKDFYCMNDDERKIVFDEINTLSKMFFDAGDSISVCIRRTYRKSKYSLMLTDYVVRHSPIMAEYAKKHRVTRQLKRFDGGNEIISNIK